MDIFSNCCNMKEDFSLLIMKKFILFLSQEIPIKNLFYDCIKAWKL